MLAQRIFRAATQRPSELTPHRSPPDEAAARAARERSEQERKTTGRGAPTMYNPRTLSDLSGGNERTGPGHVRDGCIERVERAAPSSMPQSCGR